MKYILAIAWMLSSYLTGSAQELKWGLGFEVNQTRFRQEAPLVDVAFSNPHQPDLGISAYSLFGLLLKDRYEITLKPGLSILRTKSTVTSSNKISFFDMAIDFGYSINKSLQIAIGGEYKYLIYLRKKVNGQSADFTFFANRRHFINPTISIFYDVDKNWSAHFRFAYFFQDLFNSGALDKDGHIVGPIMVYPYTIGVGFSYRFLIN